MKKRKVFLKDIIAQSPEKEYGQLYADIMLELSQGTLAPVRSAGTNGKKPALPVAFWEYVKALHPQVLLWSKLPMECQVLTDAADLLTM